MECCLPTRAGNIEKIESIFLIPFFHHSNIPLFRYIEMYTKRSLKVAGLLKKELGDILMRVVKDPAVRLATITNVKLTDDIKLAKIYISTLGDKSTRESLMQGLERAKKFIRAEIGHRIDLRYVPELHFYYDDTADYVASIDNIIQKIHSEDN